MDRCKSCNASLNVIKVDESDHRALLMGCINSMCPEFVGDLNNPINIQGKLLVTE